AVVKANAYGHGLLEVVDAIQDHVDYLAVFAFADALLLREKGVTKPLLVLSRVFADEVDLAIKHSIEVTISCFESLALIKKDLRFHLAVDTGMGRDGFVFADLGKIKEYAIKPLGIYAHFASADDAKFDDYTQKQITELLRWKEEFQPELTHHAASAGTLYGKNHPEFNLVRIGLAIYGLWPSGQRNKSINLKPVLSWRTRITEVRSLPKGGAISYGCTHILERDSKLAVLPVGYFDGISRVSSGKSYVLVRGKKVPQLGRVTMNMIVLDVTDVDGVASGDVVTLIGRDGKQEITADDWAIWSQSSNYEVVTRINTALAHY
ncbi:MAG: alanine racemase, partial [Alphaproteobacteria bacterium]|nr:alanine racemase [Alphaproteobacteria bacterium]